MSRKTKSSKLIPVTVLLDTDLIPKIESRVGALDINRSQYFRRLVRADMATEKKGPRENHKNS